jgi:3-oxoacyl-[acyl-carrier protein] reductase
MILPGKVALVTGGGRGIGAAITRVLAREGAAVAVNYHRSREKAEAVVAEITAKGGKAVAFQADVCDTDAVNRMVREVIATFGKIDGLVNNAIAGRQAGSLDEATMEDYDRAFGFGCRAIINTIRAVRPHMQKAGGGRIVNIVTELWNKGVPGWSVYLAGKGAMVGVSRSLAAELGSENITVNMVAPGWMADEKVKPGSEKGYVAGVPLRRQGSAEEIGKACAFFLSDYGAFVTGAYLPVCGGNVTQMGG